MSWDDTICSNRSSYFKMYYSQRGVIGGSKSEDGKSKYSRASSHNSLSSLIRERMGNADPSKSKKRDIGMMLLVLVLFIIIVVGISLITYFYNLHLLELSIFSCIKFFETPRILEIYDPEWKPVIKAHLGSYLPNISIPEDCTHYLHYLHRHNHSLYPALDDEETYEDMICLDWTSLARLQLRKLRSHDNVQCYSVWWVASKPDFTLRDCLMVGAEQGAWWGGGEMSGGGYPVTAANISPTSMVTGRLGRDSWGQLIRRTWVSQRSSMLKLPNTFQGHVSVNYENDRQICLESSPSRNDLTSLPMLKYTLCTAANMTDIAHHLHMEAMTHSKFVKKSEVNPIQNDDINAVHVPEKEKLVSAPDSKNSVNVSDTFKLDNVSANDISVNISETVNMSNITSNTSLVDTLEVTTEMSTITSDAIEIEPLESYSSEARSRVLERIEHPVLIPWMTPDKPELTQASILSYVEGLVELDYGHRGHILLPAGWQTQPGDFSFDPVRFPDPKAMVQKIEDLGFKVALSVHPFVSIDAPVFNNGTVEGLWVRQRESALPALVNYENVTASAITDFSNPKAKHWFSIQLNNLKTKYNISRYHLQPANSHILPTYHDYHMSIPGPDAALSQFLESVSAVSPPLSTEGAIMPPPAPTFLTLGVVDGSWEGLGTLVPRILTLAMLGFPLIDIGVVGGIAQPGYRPKRELYIRWIEIATFLPAVQLNVLPDKYGDEMEELYKKYSKVRQEVVLPRLRDRIPGALDLGLPLITPLGMFAPDDSEAANVADEWIIGDDLLIAPITREKERSRKIYLPVGIWKDEIDGRLWSGGRWIKDYKIPLTKIAYFSLKSLHEDPE